MHLEFPRSTKHWVLQGILLLMGGSLQVIQGQEGPGWTAHFGAGVGNPVGQTADFVHTGLAFTAGLGYRWNERQTVLVQYLSTGLPFNSSPLDEIGFLQPRSDLYSVTANYKFEISRKGAIRPYVIGGGGWYRRVTAITRPAIAGEIACSPIFMWWGYACEGGFVPLDKVVAGSTVDAPGFNVGAGISGRIRKAGPPRWYLEIRYHHAPNGDVPTQTLPIVLGLSW